jgi:hypothetical protein
MNQLTCPVCQRTQIETATCPNCEADLTALRILANLPPARSGLDYRWIVLGILAMMFGYVIAKLPL